MCFHLVVEWGGMCPPHCPLSPPVNYWLWAELSIPLLRVWSGNREADVDTSVKHPLQTLTAFCCQDGWIWRIFFTFFSIAFILLFIWLKLVQFMHSVRKKDIFPHYSRHTRCFFAICLSLFSPLRLVCFIPVSFFHPGTIGSISHRAGQAKIHKNNAHQTRPENLLWIPP